MSNSQHPLLRLLSHLKRHRITVLLASICSILNKIWDLAPPLLIGIAIDVVALKEESFLAEWYPDPKDQFLLLTVITAIIWILESLFQYLYYSLFNY